MNDGFCKHFPASILGTTKRPAFPATGDDSLRFRRLFADGIIKRKGIVYDAVFDLVAAVHLGGGGGIKCRLHVRIHNFYSSENGYLELAAPRSPGEVHRILRDVRLGGGQKFL